MNELSFGECFLSVIENNFNSAARQTFCHVSWEPFEKNTGMEVIWKVESWSKT